MRWPFFLALFVVAPVFGGCSGTDGPGMETAAAAPPPGTAVPRNYREIVARNIRARAGHNRIIMAQISPPGLWVGPMGLGGTRPIACVRWKVQGTLGQEEYDTGYTFADGHIDEVFTFNPLTTGGLVAAAAKHAYTCGKLTYGPFPEVMKAK